MHTFITTTLSERSDAYKTTIYTRYTTFYGTRRAIEKYTSRKRSTLLSTSQLMATTPSIHDCRRSRKSEHLSIAKCYKARSTLYSIQPKLSSRSDAVQWTEIFMHSWRLDISIYPSLLQLSERSDASENYNVVCWKCSVGTVIKNR